MKLKIPKAAHLYKRCRIVIGSHAILISILALTAQVVFCQETTLQTVNFETDGSGYTVQPQEFTIVTGGGNPDYWTRTNGGVEISPSTAFSNIQGTWFFAGEDVDYDSYITKYYVTCSSVSVSGYSDLKVKLLLGGRTGTTIEVGDFIRIEYQIDGGGYTTLAQFLGDGTLADAYLEDADANGIVDVPNVPLSASLSEFTYSIPATGSSLQIRIHVYNGTAEEVAFDNIRVIGTLSDVAPTVTTNSVTNLAAKTVTLNGTVNANDLYTDVTFEYGLTDSYGTPISAVQSPVSGTSDTDVSADITGLTPNTTYHYRVVGVNVAGTTNGSDLTFTTTSQDPIVTTLAASNILPASAKLNGTVNANDLSTNVTFEYGLTTSYGTTVTADESPVTGISDTDVSADITGLDPNTTYHYRVVGVNSEGTTTGSDLTFTTDKYSQTITFGALADKTTDDADFDPGATSSLGLDISYESTNDQVATIVNDQVHIVGAGTTNIIASQSGNNTAYAAVPVEQSLTVTQGTGIKDTELSVFNMYPNPANDFITITIKNTSSPEKVKISILDITGKVVLSNNYKGNSIKLDVCSINPGMYFITIKTQAYTKCLKTIIK